MRQRMTCALLISLAVGLAATGAEAQSPKPGPCGTASGAAGPCGPAAPAKPGSRRAQVGRVAEACETDAAMFCGDLEHREGRVSRCLTERKTEVSEACRAALTARGR